jgi:hypothetical protein
MRAILTKIVTVIALAALAGGCNHKQKDSPDGQATFDYLKAQVKVMEQGRRNMRSLKIPKPPTEPVFTRQTKIKERLTQTKEYQASLNRFYTDVIQVSRESETVLNNVQSQLSALNPDRVARKAIALATSQEQILGDVADIEIKLRAWATRAQEDMRKPHPRAVIMPHILLGTIEAMAGPTGVLAGLHEAGKGMSEQATLNNEKAREKEAEQQHLDDSLTALEDAMTKLASDKGQLLTMRNQLITSFGAQYPEHPWNSLWTAPSESTKSDVGH